MYRARCFTVIIFTLLLSVRATAQAPGERSYIAVKNGIGYFPLAANGKITPVMFAGSTAYPGVIIAIKSLQADFRSVTGSSPQLISNTISIPKTNVIIIGTLGRDSLIDRLVAEKKLDVSSIKGKWEAHITQVIENPLPGVKQALVIAGSDKRGTIYGIYGLSAQIGVSPWHWWADARKKAKYPVCYPRKIYRWRPGSKIPRHIYKRRSAIFYRMGQKEVWRCKSPGIYPDL
jgi:hypothetical protein